MIFMHGENPEYLWKGKFPTEIALLLSNILGPYHVIFLYFDESHENMDHLFASG